jgi:hypothetical protein
MATHYEIRVSGRLSEELAGSLGLHAEVHPVETTLHGDVRDSVELHTLLDRLDTLGLTVVEIRRSRVGSGRGADR